MKKTITTLAITTLLATNLASANLNNIADVSFKIKENSTAPALMFTSLAGLNAFVAATNIDDHTRNLRLLKKMKGNPVVELLQERARLVNARNNVNLDIEATAKDLQMRQYHLSNTQSHLKHAGNDSLVKVYGPAHVHRKIISERIAKTLLEEMSDLKVIEGDALKLSQIIDQKIAAGEDLYRNIESPTLAKKVMLLEDEFKYIQADSKFDDLGMVERSVKGSLISKDLRTELQADLQKNIDTYETLKHGSESVRTKLNNIDSDIIRIQNRIDEIPGKIRDNKLSSRLMKFGVVANITSLGIMTYKTIDSVVEVEVLENGEIKVIDIKDLL